MSAALSGGLGKMTEYWSLLPKSAWKYFLIEGDRLLVDNFCERNGVIEAEIFRLSDLPNQFVGVDDLESFGIDFDDGAPCFQIELPKRAA